MAARVVELCEAVKAYIEQEQSQGRYSFTFGVLRVNPRQHELSSTPFTQLYIYPAAEGPSTGTRRQWTHLYGITLHLVNYNDSNSQQELDDAYLLMEQITDSMKDARISGRSLLEFGTEDNPEEIVRHDSMLRRNLSEAAQRLIYQEMR